MLKRVRADARWLLDWHVRWMLRRSGLPDIPEVRLLLRIAWQKGSTFGATPNQPKMRAIREQVLAAASRALPDKSGTPDSLPSPAKLAEYNEIIPGTAERILCMVERSVTCKIYIEDMQAKAEIETAKMGLRVAVGLNLLAFAASIAFFALGYQVAGITFAAFPAVMLIRSYILH